MVGVREGGNEPSVLQHFKNLNLKPKQSGNLFKSGDKSMNWGTLHGKRGRLVTLTYTPGTNKLNARASGERQIVDQNTRQVHKDRPPWMCGQNIVRATARVNTRQHKGHTPSLRIEMKISDPAGNRTRAAWLEGRNFYRPGNGEG